MNKTAAIAAQIRIAREGVIAGTQEAVQALLEGIARADTRFRKVKAVRKTTSRSDPEKRAGTIYEVLATGRGPVVGTRTSAETLARAVGSSQVMLYCVDTAHRQKGSGSWRGIPTDCVQTFEVYDGTRGPNPRKPGRMVGRRVAVPVVIVRAA